MTTPTEGVPFRVGRGPAVYWDHDKDRFVAFGDDDYVDPGPQPAVAPATAQRYPNAHYRVRSGQWTLELGAPAPETRPLAERFAETAKVEAVVEDLTPPARPSAPPPPTSAPAPAPAPPAPEPAPAPTVANPPAPAAPAPAASAPPAPPVARETPAPAPVPAPTPAPPPVATPAPSAPARPEPPTVRDAPPLPTRTPPAARETPPPPPPKIAEPEAPGVARKSWRDRLDERRERKRSEAAPYPERTPLADDAAHPRSPSPSADPIDRWLDEYRTPGQPYEGLSDLEAPPASDPPKASGNGVDILAPPPPAERRAPIDDLVGPDRPKPPEPPAPAAPPKTTTPEAPKTATPAPAPTPPPPAAPLPPPPAPAPDRPAPPARATATGAAAAAAAATTPAPPKPAEDKTATPPPRVTPPPPARAPTGPALPPPLYEPPERRPASRRVVAIVIVVALIAAAIGLGAVLLSRDDDKGGTPKADFPAQWDPKVATLAQFVEREREARFENPVHVDFLSDDEFAQRAHDIAREPVTTADPLLKLPTPVLRALGLVQGDAKPAEAAAALEASRPALYSTATQRIAVRGSDLDQGTKAAIVRAMTLALDQQRYGLKTDIEDDQGAWAYAALREGDATRVSNAYLGALDPAERAGIEDPFNADVAGATEVVRVLAKAPSVLGEQFVDALLADGGTKALDRAFARPPFGQEHLFDATAFLTGNDPKDVDPPTLQSGETKQANGTLGVLTWLAVLGEHTPPDVALRAANGWGGDSYATYEFQKRQCIRASWIGDTPQDVDDMSQALGAWVTAMPPGDSQFNNESGVVTMSSCDPGANEAVSTGQVSDAFALVTLRAEAFKRQVAQNVPVDKAWCIADRVASGATVKEAQDPSVLDTPDYASKISQYALDCT